MKPGWWKKQNRKETRQMKSGWREIFYNLGFVFRMFFLTILVNYNKTKNKSNKYTRSKKNINSFHYYSPLSTIIPIIRSITTHISRSDPIRVLVKCTIYFLLFTFHFSLLTSQVEARFLFFGRKTDDEIRQEKVERDLKSEDKYIRRAAVRKLGRIKNERAKKKLRKALKDKDDNVRAFAAFSLGRIKDKSSVGALIEALNDERLVVKIEAIRALGEIGEPEAIPTLLPLIENVNPRLRCEVASSLGKLGNKEGLNAVLKEIEDKNSPVRVKAILALRDIGEASERILDTLRDLKYDEDERVVAAAKLVLEYFGEE